MSDLTHAEINALIGRNIRTRRQMAGLSQTFVAAHAGIVYQQLHKCERGINRVPAGRLPRLAAAMGCKVEDFFIGLGEVAPLDERVVDLLKDAATLPDEQRAAICAIARAMTNLPPEEA